MPFPIPYRAAYILGVAALSFLTGAFGNQSEETKSDSESALPKNPDGKDVGSKSFPNPAHNSATKAIYYASYVLPLGCGFGSPPRLTEEEESHVLPQKDAFVNLCLNDTQRIKSLRWWNSHPDLKRGCTTGFWFKFNEEFQTNEKAPKDISIKYVRKDKLIY